MKAGYVRSSGWNPKVVETQEKALQAAGCTRFYTDSPESKSSGLDAAVQDLKVEDVLVVTKLDRVGRPIKGLVDLINTLESKSVAFVAIEDGVDTRTDDGRYLVHVMKRLSLMDKALVSERTQQSLRIAKEKGRTGGRPPALSEEQKAEASRLIASGIPVRAVAKLIGSNHATLYRHIGAKPVVRRS
ncbi:MAG: recombinase family protein [Rhodoferax sp.]|nr:recombinase family protein [Rhodoferax sp.]